MLAVLDFFPSLKDEELFLLLNEQRMYLSDRKAEGFLNGIFHKKLAALFLKAAGIRGEEMTGRLSDKKLLAAAELIKRTVVEVTAANSFDKAQVCMGGVRGKDVDPLSLIHIFVISVEKVKEQAEKFGHSETRELAFLVAHSMLHLSGYDHMEDEERLDMEEKQREILERRGYRR